MTVSPYPYQVAAIEAVLKDYDAGYRSVVLALATGTGKTITSILLAREFCQRRGITDPRVLFLGHRTELVKQTIRSLARAWPEVSVGRIQSHQCEFGRQWSVGMVQTAMQPKRRKRLGAQKYDVIVADECHHAPSKSFRETIAALRGPDSLVLGLTATPNRADGVALSEVFERISYSYLLPEAIEDGFLVDLEGILVPLDLDLDAVKTDGGDFAESSLQELMSAPEVVSATVQAWFDHGEGRRTVAFGVKVEHAERLQAEFRRRGVACELVHGGVDEDTRDARYLALKEGRIQVLVNVMVLTEGFDEPSVACVLLARPTASHSLYTQIVGRGARLSPGKSNCRVIDVTGTCTRLSLQSLPMLGGLPPQNPTTAERQSSKPSEERKRPPVHVPSLLGVAKQARNVNLLRVPRGQRFQWASTPHGAALSVGGAGFFLVAPDERQGLYRVLHGQWLREVEPEVLGAPGAARVEQLATLLPVADAVGLAEAEAARFSPRRGPGAPKVQVGPANAAEVELAVQDIVARQRRLEAEAGHPLERGAALAAGQALTRLLVAARRVTEAQAAALTVAEAMQMRQGAEVPARLRGMG
jgi:superfamily II DNA or RNA helicase